MTLDIREDWHSVEMFEFHNYLEEQFSPYLKIVLNEEPSKWLSSKIAIAEYFLGEGEEWIPIGNYFPFPAKEVKNRVILTMRTKWFNKARAEVENNNDRIYTFKEAREIIDTMLRHLDVSLEDLITGEAVNYDGKDIYKHFEDDSTTNDLFTIDQHIAQFSNSSYTLEQRMRLMRAGFQIREADNWVNAPREWLQAAAPARNVRSQWKTS